MQGTNRISRGWQLTKSSWQVLILDKELAALPLLSIITTALFVIVGGALTVLGMMAYGAIISDGSFSAPGWVNALLLVILYGGLTVIANYFSGAIIYGATERFNGGDPTVRSSLAGVRKKFRPLALFSLMMATVGLVLQAIEDRVPLAGKIAVWLVNASWSIANIFAIPVIVLSEKNVNPLEATKESVRIIRQVWGEGVVAQLGISVISALSLFAYTAIWLALGFGAQALVGAAIPAIAVIVFLTVAFVGLFALGLLFTALNSIAKAAVYHYAVTGTAPEMFNKDLLRAAMTPKKARKIFA
jgi:hypothetical protein